MSGTPEGFVPQSQYDDMVSNARNLERTIALLRASAKCERCGMTTEQKVKKALQPQVRKKCKYGDPFCPCQDGDTCHYKDENPWPLPSTEQKEYWRLLTDQEREKLKMSDCYDIACHNCKVGLWIGQSGASPWTFYSGESETMQSLRVFLWIHRGHQLEFNETQTFEFSINSDYEHDRGNI
jgi:hypothetical protein